MSTTTDQDRTLTFPHVVAKRMAEAAIERDNARQETYRQISSRLGDFDRLGQVVELGGDDYVIEILASGRVNDRTMWAAAGKEDGRWRFDFQRFYTLDEALLRAVELRNGGGPNDRGHIYAARMLGVKATIDADA